MHEDTAILRIQDLNVSFHTDDGVRNVLHDINLHLNANEILGVVGESGSGKSVLAQSIMRLLPQPSAHYDSGKILFEGENLLDASPKHLHQIRGCRIAMIFQEPIAALNPVHTIGRQLLEVFELHQPELDKQQRHNAAVKLLEDVGIRTPEERMQQYPHQQSGGICQRVMIAMALACQPAILIADEPTTALDVTTQKTILQLLRDLQPKFDTSMLFITHDLGVVAELCDRAIVLENGYIREQASVKDLFERPQNVYTQRLISSYSHPFNTMPNTDKEEQDIVLSVRQLVKSFPTKRTILNRPKEWFNAVDDVCFDLYEGETLAVVGESGCGKSTLARAILYLDPPTSGTVIFEDQDLDDITDFKMQDMRQHMQIIFQDTNESLDPRQIIEQILLEPFEVHELLTPKERLVRIQYLLDMVELPHDALHRYPHEFSGGQRQRIGIARALACEPRLLVCDEAVSALDVTTQTEILDLLKRIQDETKLSLLFITHDFSTVKALAHRTLVMRQGKMVELRDTVDLFNDPHADYTKELLDSVPSLYRQSA